MKKKVGLLMGSYNPVHIGHMGMANFMLEFTDMDEIMFVVSPQNPFKVNKTMLDEKKRLGLVEMAIGISENMVASDIEFKMSKPSYTVDTLKALQSQNPETEYVLIIGSDNLTSFKQWKDYQYILDNHTIYCYDRIGYTDYDKDFVKDNNIIIVENCPSIELSSTFIRDALKKGKNMKYFLPPGIQHHIKQNKYY